jgi:fructose-bisphosphate aldolase class II
MSFATIKELLVKAREGRYAVGSFNAWDIQSARTVMAAAAEERSPVIISVWKEEIDMCGMANLFGVCRNEIADSPVPAALFLDHGRTKEECLEAVEHGCTSVMIDGSYLPLTDNIRLVREVVEKFHGRGIAVEGELGVLGEEGGGGAPTGSYTEPEDARKFSARSGVDCLAVAIGNAHGFYREEPKLDFDRLAAIEKLVDIPLVLHGGSGIPNKDIVRAIASGIAKINVGAAGRKAFFDGIKQVFRAKPEEHFPSVVYRGGYEKHKTLVKEKMRLFGSSGRAGAVAA